MTTPAPAVICLRLADVEWISTGVDPRVCGQCGVAVIAQPDHDPAVLLCTHCLSAEVGPLPEMPVVHTNRWHCSECYFGLGRD